MAADVWWKEVADAHKELKGTVMADEDVNGQNDPCVDVPLDMTVKGWREAFLARDRRCRAAEAELATLREDHAEMKAERDQAWDARDRYRDELATLRAENERDRRARAAERGFSAAIKLLRACEAEALPPHPDDIDAISGKDWSESHG